MDTAQCGGKRAEWRALEKAKPKSAPGKRRNFSGRGNVHRVEDFGACRAERAEAIRRLGAGGTPQNLAKTMRRPCEQQAAYTGLTRGPQAEPWLSVRGLELHPYLNYGAICCIVGPSTENEG